MKMAKEEGWLQMQWFDSVKPQSDGDEMEGVEMSDNAAVKAKGIGLKAGSSDYIGLGTMMQDATDYLGERQQEDYTRWKAKILARVQELEASA
jgi:origin recognition complex subunit 6